jgi:hypothetical protein
MVVIRKTSPPVDQSVTESLLLLLKVFCSRSSDALDTWRRVSFLLSLRELVSQLQRVTSRDISLFFFKKKTKQQKNKWPFPVCVMFYFSFVIQNFQMLQVCLTRLGVGELRAAFSYYLHQATKSRVGTSDWQTWPVTPFFPVEPIPTAHDRQMLHPLWPGICSPSRTIGHYGKGMRSCPTAPERPPRTQQSRSRDLSPGPSAHPLA